MEFEKQVKETLDLIRPSLQNDGGDIEFIKVEGKKVYVKLTGSCAGCPMAAMTLKGGVERVLQTNIDEEIEVINTAFED